MKIIKSNEESMFRYVKLTNQLSFELIFLLINTKSGLSYRGEVVSPRYQTPQGQSVAKPGTPL